MNRISVVIPTKNRAETISRAVNSILLQSYPPAEVIVVDDNSDDNTKEILDDMRENTDINIRYLKNEQTKGGAVSRNRGASAANGEYIAFLDSDDEWLPDHLKEALTYIDENKVEACYSDYLLVGGTESIDAYRNKTEENVSIADLLFKRVIDPRTSTFVFKKAAFDQVKFDDDQQKHQDWDIALRFSKQFEMGCTNKVTVKLHHDTGNRMSAKINHKASIYFMDKHLEDVHPENGITFLIYLAWSTAVVEGKSMEYVAYIDLISKLKKQASTIGIKEQVKLTILSLPIVVFRRIDKVLEIRRRINYRLTSVSK